MFGGQFGLRHIDAGFFEPLDLVGHHQVSHVGSTTEVRIPLVKVNDPFTPPEVNFATGTVTDCGVELSAAGWG
jgi:hypothetical protein